MKPHAALGCRYCVRLLLWNQILCIDIILPVIITLLAIFDIFMIDVHSPSGLLTFTCILVQVFDCLGQQEELFKTVSKPIAARFLDGYNGTIFAYGQTGSGKTYTVEGSARRYKDRGMIPRVISYIYEALENRGDGEEWKIEMSFMEIYQDVGYDLLNPGSQGQSMMVKLPRVSTYFYFVP